MPVPSRVLCYASGRERRGTHACESLECETWRARRRCRWHPMGTGRVAQSPETCRGAKPGARLIGDVIILYRSRNTEREVCPQYGAFTASICWDDAPSRGRADHRRYGSNSAGKGLFKNTIAHKGKVGDIWVSRGDAGARARCSTALSLAVSVRVHSTVRTTLDVFFTTSSMSSGTWNANFTPPTRPAFENFRPPLTHRAPTN